MKVEIFTDGACSPNPGPGGWAAIIRVPGEPDRELSGPAASTTNNQMELMGAIQGLEALPTDRGPLAVQLTTDSQYVKNGIQSWIHGWKRNGWKTAAKKDVLNKELWQRLDEAAARHNVVWLWVRGHNGHPLNERVDRLAVAARLQVA